jgi:hypothetical protein
MPQVFPLNSCKSLLFHGGDTGSIPVRDANLLSIIKTHSTIFPTIPFIMDVLNDGNPLINAASLISTLDVAAVLRR